MWNRRREIHHQYDTCGLGPDCVVLENYIGTNVYFCWTVSFKAIHPILRNKPLTFKHPEKFDNKDYFAEVE
jgi:hypothetical protein